MTIVDTSLIIPLFGRDGSAYTRRMANELADLDIHLTSITQLEILLGARDEAEWRKIETFLTTQEIISPAPIIWQLAARTYDEARRVDCLIAEIAINRNMTLLHDDRDFEAIATVRPPSQRRIDLRVQP